MVPEIWNATDKTFSHFGLFLTFYPPNNPENQNFQKMKKRKKNTSRYRHFTQVYQIS